MYWNYPWASKSSLEPDKEYVATLYADGKEADYEKNPTSYQIKKGIVTNKTKMSVKLARSGGFALSLIEAAPSDRKSIKKWKWDATKTIVQSSLYF